MILKNSLMLLFKGIRRFSVCIYSCGPTVYSNTHIGHARTYISQDIIRRILEIYKETPVFYALGVTDIDDKIVNKSKELNTSIKNISELYEKEFFESMKKLGMKEPNMVCRVSDHIDDIIKYIQVILNNGYGYVSKSGVLFNLEKYSNAYKYNHFNLNLVDSDFTQSEFSNDKRDTRDFYLWKFMDDNSSIQSPWGLGRPGWHIECSANISSLPYPLDYHLGGEDLIFPHHTNEIAQFCAYTNKKWEAKFLHTGHVYIEGRKMSKSLKNFITGIFVNYSIVDELLKKIDGDTFRYFCLKHKYESRINFAESFINTCEIEFNLYKNVNSNSKIDDGINFKQKKCKYLGYERDRVV